MGKDELKTLFTEDVKLNRKDILCSWIRILKVVKMSFPHLPPVSIFRFRAIPIKITACIFVAVNQLIIKLI